MWKIERGALPAALALLLAATFAQPARAHALPGRSERLTPGTANSWYPSISADGRFVAFQSYVGDLIPGDTNGASDVFVADRAAGTLERVSVSSGGAQANQHSWSPSMTPDGRYVAFTSGASNLVSGDHNGHIDVFVHDRVTNETERVSVGGDGTEGEWISGGSDGFTGTFYAGIPAISDDGRRVAFWSFAKEIDPIDEDWNRDAFVHDRQTGETRLVSVSSTGSQGGCCSVIGVDISGDGNVVAFTANVGGLVPGDTNGAYDVFVHDLRTRVTERVSVDSSGEQGNAVSWNASINHDGRFVAFSGSATNLVPDDFNSGGGADDVFVRDRLLGRTERISVSSLGREGNDHSYKPDISPDGRFVAFGSYADTLVAGDTGGTPDLFLADRLTGSTQQLSVSDGGADVSGYFGTVALSDDGAFIAFEGRETDLVPGGGDAWNVFVRELASPLGIGGLSATEDGDRVSISGFARVSGVLLASGSDPAGDGLLQGQDVGADLVGGAITYRPGEGDLAVRLDLSRLVRPGTAGHRGVVYGVAFRVGGQAFEVRANRLGATMPTPTVENGYALYRCDATPCGHVTALSGSVGTTGEAVTLSLPLSLFGATPALTGLRGFAGFGEMAAGVVHELDSVSLGDAPPPPAPSVRVAIAPADAGEPAFTETAAFADGRFSGSVEAPGPGAHDVWARVCLGAECAAAHRRIEI